MEKSIKDYTCHKCSGKNIEAHGLYCKVGQSQNESMKTQYITTDGAILSIVPNNGLYFTLEEMQKAVGGLVEMLPLPDGRTMIINEEGKLVAEPVKNREATNIWKKQYPKKIYPISNDELIVGNVIITNEKYLQ